MSLGIVPVIGLIAVMMLSGTSTSSMNRAVSYYIMATPNVVLQVPLEPAVDYPEELNRVSESSANPESDFQAIRQYIQSIYTKVSPDEADSIARYLVDYGQRHEIDPKLAAALIARESGFNKNAISKTGAKGLGQIKDFNFSSLDMKDPFDTKENVSGTTAYLKRMLSFWKDKSKKVSLAIASYYKGHNAIKKNNEMMDAPTKAYVQDILKNYQKLLSLGTVSAEGYH